MTMNAPIPGESLTTTPKNAVYERPPEINDPEEALMMYMERLSSKETMGDIIDALELGVDLRTLTEGILRLGVSKGMHSIDISLSIAPAIHEYIKSFADELGTEYDEGLVDVDAEERKREQVLFAKANVRNRKASGESQKTAEMEMPVEEVAPEIQEEEDKPKGLMARR